MEALQWKRCEGLIFYCSKSIFFKVWVQPDLKASPALPSMPHSQHKERKPGALGLPGMTAGPAVSHMAQESHGGGCKASFAISGINIFFYNLGFNLVYTVHISSCVLCDTSS